MGALFYAPFDTEHGSNVWTRGRGFQTAPSTETVDADGTFVGKRDRLIHPARANVLRVEQLGALLEGTRTNICKQSEDFNTTWVDAGITLNTNQAVAPDGNTTADELLESDATEEHRVIQSITFDGSSVYTFSVFAKANGRTALHMRFPSGQFVGAPHIRFDFLALTATTLAATVVSSSIEAWPNGWFRCIASATSDVAAGGNVLLNTSDATNDLSYDGTTTLGLYLWGAQVEAATFASSYIPTTTGSVARTADALQYPNTAESNAKAVRGTLMCLFTPVSGAAPAAAGVVDLRAADNADGPLLQHTTGSKLRWFVRAGGATVCDKSTSTSLTSGLPAVVAGVWERNNFRIYLNGIEEDKDTDGAEPEDINPVLFIGEQNDGGSDVDANIAHLLIFGRVLNEGEIGQVTQEIRRRTQNA